MKNLDFTAVMSAKEIHEDEIINADVERTRILALEVGLIKSSIEFKKAREEAPRRLY